MILLAWLNPETDQSIALSLVKDLREWTRGVKVMERNLPTLDLLEKQYTGETHENENPELKFFKNSDWIKLDKFYQENFSRLDEPAKNRAVNFFLVSCILAGQPRDDHWLRKEPYFEKLAIGGNLDYFILMGLLRAIAGDLAGARSLFQKARSPGQSGLLNLLLENPSDKEGMISAPLSGPPGSEIGPDLKNPPRGGD